jgi:hypothetical protein
MRVPSWVAIVAMQATVIGLFWFVFTYVRP